MALKVAEEWLNVCGGCEMSILDIGEPLLDLLNDLEFVHIPFLMDGKYFGQTGEGAEMDIPEADVGIITGGIRNAEDKKVADLMRKKCKKLIALGSCACYGGIPALANMYPLKVVVGKVHKKTRTTVDEPVPRENLPPLTDPVMAVDEVVSVDAYVPGCPVNPDLIVEALKSFIEDKPFELAERSVCDECPVKREKKASGGTLRRQIEPVDVAVGEPWENTRCYMEQGFLCLGPVTRSGCAKEVEGGGGKVPRCIFGHMTCRGCFGPIRKSANPLVDMMTAVSSIGLDPKQVMDRRAMLNRYIGGQKRLKPLPPKKPPAKK